MKDVVVLSALEMVENMSDKDEGVEMMPEVPTAPLLKSHLVVVKKIKMQQSWVPQGKVQPPP